jgi:hypothetical protein
MPAHDNTSPPSGPDGTVYLVLDDFGRFGRAWRETDEGKADRQTVVANLLSGQYEHPLRIVAFNAAEGWARDVTAEIAGEISERICDDDERAPALRDFLDRAVPPRPGPGSWAVSGLEPLRPGTGQP